MRARNDTSRTLFFTTNVLGVNPETLGQDSMLSRSFFRMPSSQRLACDAVDEHRERPFLNVNECTQERQKDAARHKCRLSFQAALVPVQKRQKFLPRFRARPHASQHAAGGGGCARLLYASHDHAQVGRFHHDGYALRLQHFAHRECDLLGQSLLDLKSAREHFREASEFGQPNDPSVGNVTDCNLVKGSASIQRYQKADHTLPVKGTRWCSHNENTSMFFTITSSSWFSENTALFTKSRTFSSYPLVKKSIAFAYLDGVPSRPSRSGSSPRHSNMVVIAPSNFSKRSSASSGVASKRAFVPRPV